MTKSELIKIMKAKHPEMQLKEVAFLVDIFFDMMSDTLKNKGRVEIRGFGTFSLRTRKPRLARNPKTGEKVQIDERESIYFRAGKALKTKINS